MILYKTVSRHQEKIEEKRYRQRSTDVLIETIRSNPPRTYSIHAVQRSASAGNRLAEEIGITPVTGTEAIDPNNNQTTDLTDHTSMLGFQRDHGPIERQSLISSASIALKYRLYQLIGIGTRVLKKVRSITIGPGNFSIEIETGRILDSSCYVELASNSRWRAAQCPPRIRVRTVAGWEMTNGMRSLIDKAGCAFMTDASTPMQTSKPLEVPSCALTSLMRSLSLDIVHKGKLFLIFASGFKSSRKVTVSIIPEVDHVGNNRSSGMDDVQVDRQILKASLHVTDVENVAFVVHRVKAQYQNSAFTDVGKRIVAQKFKGKEYSLVLI